MDRKALLANLIRDRFDGRQADFARAIGKSPSQVNQWLTGVRSFGDASARHTEITLGLGQGYFDGAAPQRSGEPAAPALSPRQQALLGLFDGLTADEQDKVIRELEEAQRRAEEAALKLTPERLEALLREKRRAA